MPRAAQRSDDLPMTLARSAQKVQRTYRAAHESAEHTYGEGERARRTALAAVKHSFEKVGDHWEPKQRKGPSDEHAAGGRASDTAQGVDANASKAHLLRLARRLDVPGRSTMNKDELIGALQKANRRETQRTADAARRRQS